MIFSPSLRRIIGVVLVIFSFVMLLPIVVGIWFGEASLFQFLYSFIVLFCVGFIVWLPVRKAEAPLRIKQSFVLVSVVWVVLGTASALPFILSGSKEMGLVNSLFEALSGLTTTGASIIENLNNYPQSLLFYRHLLQWIGGLGIIVIAAVVAPTLGIGAMQLSPSTIFRASQGDIKPRIGGIARALWHVYLVLTAMCVFAYWVAGMNVFDALCVGMSTISIGGFSPYNDNMGHFSESPAILAVSMVFMMVAAMNFSLHFIALSHRTIAHYFSDTEVLVFISIIASVVCITLVYGFLAQNGSSAPSNMLLGAFHAVSISTTTGFTTADYFGWPPFLTALLLLASFAGCCTGSTGGGLKVYRFWLLLLQSVREVSQMLHPHAVFPLKIGHRAVSARHAQSVWGFFSAYVVCLVVISLLLLLSGMDHVSAFSAAASTLNNLGPGLGEVSANYASISDFSKIVLCLSMILGRLEIFALLVFLSPNFWRS